MQRLGARGKNPDLILSLLAPPLVIYPVFSKVTKSTCASILLCELFAFCEWAPADGWFETSNEHLKKLTSMNDRELDQGLQVLLKKKLIEKRVSIRNPSLDQIRVNMRKVGDQTLAFLKRQREFEERARTLNIKPTD
jgi:hypothetical protein